jgi:hypothetical protein
MSNNPLSRPAGIFALSTLIAASAGSSSAHEGHVHKSPTEAVESSARSATSNKGEPNLAEVRKATERFRNVDVALAEGYVRDPSDLCDTAEMMGKSAALGAMDIHFFRPDLLGITSPPNPRVDGSGVHIDFRQPSILIYEPQANGSLELVAVENLVFQKAWHAAGNTTIPTFHGVAYDVMADNPSTAVDEAHMFEPHYDRHVWIYRENPNGVFAPFNPNVTCQYHRGEGHQHHAAAQ